MEQNESRPARLPETGPNSAKEAESAEMAREPVLLWTRLMRRFRARGKGGKDSLQPYSPSPHPKEVVTGQRRSPIPPPFLSSNLVHSTYLFYGSGRAANNCTTLVYEKESSTFWRRRCDFFSKSQVVGCHLLK